MERPLVPRAQLLYGTVIYWFCVAATLICTVGPVVSIAFPNRNIMDPNFLFLSIWKGNPPDTVWQEVGKGFPGGHFWLVHPGNGDSLIQLGLVIGCSCAFFPCWPPP